MSDGDRYQLVLKIVRLAKKLGKEANMDFASVGKESLESLQDTLSKLQAEAEASGAAEPAAEKAKDEKALAPPTEADTSEAEAEPAKKTRKRSVKKGTTTRARRGRRGRKKKEEAAEEPEGIDITIPEEDLPKPNPDADKALIVDACYSGGMVGGGTDLDNRPQLGNCMWLLSQDESDGDPGLDEYGQYLKDALTKGADGHYRGDSDKDGDVDMNEWLCYAVNKRGGICSLTKYNPDIFTFHKGGCF